ncbi:MAG: hypothetical protein RLZZ336_1528, partial [Cyanobacteriota bacterium]
YLAYNGIDARLPREVIKQAFATGLLADGELWIAMLEERNLMAHTYDDTKAKAAVTQIQSRYMAGLRQLQELLAARHEEMP